jgi:hypothetical protein
MEDLQMTLEFLWEVIIPSCAVTKAFRHLTKATRSRGAVTKFIAFMLRRRSRGLKQMTPEFSLEVSLFLCKS